ncbi:MAG: hypothetical protein CVV44_01245 [Spirochaetae bacterium HGW-Spirochaetae-1]|jgi:serine/threonine-protein kinase|nr:MAG: hypothetical protein CVV44_01245 [Spirochaetae bacterium HGW-Spirochaetae-1]
MKNEQSNEIKPKFKYFNSIGKIILIFFIGFSVYLFISTMMMIFLTKSSREIKVPDVVGKQFTDVYNSLIRKGITPEIKFYDVTDIENGMILNQYPENGTIITEDTPLKLVVSRSGRSIEVPNLIGSNLPIARNKLKNMQYHGRSASISTGIVSYIPSQKTAENIVISQFPKAGDTITPDRKVNLLVSAGSIKDDGRIPPVEGQSIDICYDLLTAKGITIIQDIAETGNQGNSGIVLAQNPPKGSPLTANAVINLKVAWYPLTEHPYHAYEKVDYTIDEDQGEGLYEVLIDDNDSKRIRFSRKMKSGQNIRFIYHRTGNARISIMKDKKVIHIMGVSVEEFD